MKKFLAIVLLTALATPGLAQRPCLRIMLISELVQNASLIARVKVLRTENVKFRGSYGQLATIHPVDVLEGDFTLKEINVLARSNVQCAEDSYTHGQEMLVFLVREESLFRTVNFQYGQFPIVGEVVKGWRDKANKPMDKPYAEVAQEIDTYVNSGREAPGEVPPAESLETKPPKPTKPPQARRSVEPQAQPPVLKPQPVQPQASPAKPKVTPDGVAAGS
jgi:hypothetical protein